MQAALGGALPAGLLSVAAQFGQTQRAPGEASWDFTIYHVRCTAGYVTPSVPQNCRNSKSLDKAGRQRQYLWAADTHYGRLGASLLLSMLIE